MFKDLHQERLDRSDGARVMQVLRRYLQPGDDPVKVLLDLCRQAGWDVPEPLDEEEDKESS